jgi:hypothetical protein
MFKYIYNINIDKNLKVMNKKNLNEKLGVPDNIIETSKKIYELTYNKIDENLDFDDINEFRKKISGDFKIGEIGVNEVSMGLKIVEYHELLITGMQVQFKVKVDGGFNIVTITEDLVKLQINFGGPKTTKGSDIKEILKQNKNETIASIAHELKHHYDNYKNNKRPIKKRVRYETGNSSSFGNIKPINNFIFYIYYTHIIESLVRPTELASLIDSGAVTKKEFINFLTKNDTYKKLTDIKKLNYDNFRESIKGQIPKLKTLFDMNKINYDSMSDEEIVNLTLRLLYINLLKWEGEKFVDYLRIRRPESNIFGFNNEDDIFIEKYEKERRKFENDYVGYFKNEIKNFHNISDKMIRKLSKLYDLAL